MQSLDQTFIELVLRFTAAATLTLASGVLFALRQRLHPRSTWAFLSIVVFAWSIFRWGIFALAFVDKDLGPAALAELSPWLNQLSQTFAILVGIGVAVAAWGEREG